MIYIFELINFIQPSPDFLTIKVLHKIAADDILIFSEKLKLGISCESSA